MNFAVFCSEWYRDSFQSPLPIILIPGVGNEYSLAGHDVDYPGSAVFGLHNAPSNLEDRRRLRFARRGNNGAEDMTIRPALIPQQPVTNGPQILSALFPSSFEIHCVAN